MRERQLIYGWSHMIKDQPLAVKGFWDMTQLYMRTNGIEIGEFMHSITLSVSGARLWKYYAIMGDTQQMYVPWSRRALALTTTIHFSGNYFTCIILCTAALTFGCSTCGCNRANE